MGRKAVSKTPLGRRLTEVREARGYAKRADLAAYLGINPETLGGYERGDTEPDVTFFQMYKDLFGISLDWLIAGEGEMYVNRTLNVIVEKAWRDSMSESKVDPELLLSVSDTMRRAYEMAGWVGQVDSDIRPLALFFATELVAKDVDLNDPATFEEQMRQLSARVGAMAALMLDGKAGKHGRRKAMTEK